MGRLTELVLGKSCSMSMCVFYRTPNYTFLKKLLRIASVAFFLWGKQSSSIFWHFKKDRSKKYLKTQKLKIYFSRAKFFKIWKIEKSKIEKVEFQLKIYENRKSENSKIRKFSIEIQLFRFSIFRFSRFWKCLLSKNIFFTFLILNIFRSVFFKMPDNQWSSISP